MFDLGFKKPSRRYILEVFTAKFVLVVIGNIYTNFLTITSTLPLRGSCYLPLYNVKTFKSGLRINNYNAAERFRS